MTSDEGLNAYGAATWGQFFIYQGFNANAGWMHTSTGVDNVDEFAETIVPARTAASSTATATQLRPVTTSRRSPCRTAPRTARWRSAASPSIATHHGPIVREADGKWIAFALMNKPVEALQQSLPAHQGARLRGLHEGGGAEGQLLEQHALRRLQGRDRLSCIPQFMPLRDDRFDYTQAGRRQPTRRPTGKGCTASQSLPQVVNPTNGWMINTNNWPWTAAGADSPNAADFPRYMDQAGENPRGPHAVRVLTARNDFTPQTLLAAAFDPYLTAFARLVPGLVAAWDKLPAGNQLKAKLAGPIGLLRGWDYTWGAQSTATSLAVFWGEALWAPLSGAARDAGMSMWDYLAERATDAQRLAALATAADRLTQDFGSWQVPWGEINRFQRNDGAIAQTFDDAKPSIPVPFTSSQWGSLASFGAKRYPGTKRYYGTSGNSFVAVVEFGPRLRAWAVTAGGESGTSRLAALQRPGRALRRAATSGPSTSIPRTSRATSSGSYKPGK